jgi:hypothetical protein
MPHGPENEIGDVDLREPATKRRLNNIPGSCGLGGGQKNAKKAARPFRGHTKLYLEDNDSTLVRSI